MTDFEQQIGPFRLHSEVGRTPTATKYRATDSRNGQSVALYVQNPELAGQPAAVQQFLTAGRRAIRLRHPNLIAVLEAGEAAGVAYIATEWMRGQSIGERLRRSGRTADLETVIHLVRGVAAALDYAHSEGFVHGHLTLGQIYITEENVVLVDGFAQSADLGALSATPPVEAAEKAEISYPPLIISPFLAPEQAHTGQTVDLRTDVYSLGAIIYTLLLGRPPFFADEPTELLTQIIEKAPPPPEAINPTLPTALVYVLKSVLAKDPTIRYGSAGELSNALQQSSQWYPTTADQIAPDVYSRPRPQPPRKRRQGLAVVLPLLITLLFGVIMISIGLGALGDQFAFIPQTQETNGFVARVRTLLLPQPAAVVELTANPVSLTPVMATTLTPPTASRSGQLLAQAPGVNRGETLTVTNRGALTATMTSSPTPTTSPTVAPETVTATHTGIPTLAQLPIERTATDSGLTEPALEIDPFGLLAGAVQAGDVVINGNAAPASQVQIQVNGKSQGRTNVKATGTWALIVTLNEPGDYEVTVQALDAAGAVIETAQRTITIVSAAATAPVTTTVTPNMTPTVTLVPSATATVPPTATATNTALPTATATHTAQPTATRTNTAQPTVAFTPTVTNTPLPTVTYTPTPRPTATVTRTPSPTATTTPVPTATNTPLPTATYTHTPIPTATDTPLPTKTNTPTLTATHTLAPTLTSTPLPTATNTPVPTATNTPPPTATYTPLPPATNTPVPTATNTPAPTATPTAVTGSIQPIAPGEGESGRGQRSFEWSANFTPSAGYGFEIVFWKPGQSPMGQSFGMAAPTTNLKVTLDLDRLDEQLGDLFDTGEYEWGILLVRTTPAYERVQYLGGGRRFTYYREGGGDSSSGGQSSGE